MFIHNNISESNFQKENEDLKLEIQKYIPIKNSDQSPNLADEGDKEKAQNFANMIEHTKLVDVVKSVQICFDPIERCRNSECCSFL